MTAADTSAETGFRLNGWHALAMICGFFAVVMTVDGAFTYLALKTHPGEVSVTPYEDGLLYDKHVAQMRAQDALGWQAAAVAEPGAVVFEVHDRADRPVRGLSIDAKLERPATESGRITPKFDEASPGRYEAPTGAISGAWDFTAAARDASGRRFLAERRLTWR